MKIVKTTTSDKLHLTGFLSETEGGDRESIIVHIHGMAGDPYTNVWYPYFHELFPQKGIAFLVGNHRGTGSVTMFFREPDKYPNYGDAFEIFKESVIDIDAWVKYAKKLGYKNIYIQSHSFAPSKVVQYMFEKNPPFVKKLIFISPVDMLGITLVDKPSYKRMYSEAKSFLKKGKGNQFLSELLDGEYYISAKTFVDLFSNNSLSNVFCYTNRKHDWKRVNAITKPVLIIGGTNDMPMKMVSGSKEAMDILKDQLKKSPKVITKLYKEAEHSFEGFEKRIIRDVSDFIKE